ncbi:MAG: DUF5666 domain-containing protein [Rhodospirillales bacterium]
MRRMTGILAAAAFAAATAAGAAAAADDSGRVAAAAEGEWISLTGTVKAVHLEQFVLDYGPGGIVVEMDGPLHEEDSLQRGDRVIVNGRMDADFFQKKRIEAGSVFVPRLDKYFYASTADEESGYHSHAVARERWPDAADGDGAGGPSDWTAVAGTVERLDGTSMTIDAGARTIRVDTTRLSRPLGARVDVGDRVSVSGETDPAHFMERREIVASSVVVLAPMGRRATGR